MRGEVNLEQLILLSFARQRSNLVYDYVVDQLNGRQNNSKFSVYSWATAPNRIADSVNRAIVKRAQKDKEKGENEAAPYKPSLDKLTLELRNISSALGHSRLSNDEKRYADEIVNKILAVEGRQRINDTSRVDRLESIKQKRRVFATVWSDALPVSLLEGVENLLDQKYLKAMRDIFEQLNSNSANPTLVPEDIRRLIYCGPLSEYLYFRMKEYDIVRYQSEAVSLAPIMWVKLAEAIITEMVTIKYSPNNQGHPAGKHLLEIVEFLFGEGAEELAFEIAEKAVKAPSSAGGDLFRGAAALTKYATGGEKIKSLKVWKLYRTALLNKNIVPNDLTNEHDVNWFFVEWFQSRSKSDPHILWWVEIMRAALDINGEQAITLGEKDAKAVKKSIDLIKALQSFGDMTFDYDSDIPAHRAKWQKAEGDRRQADIKYLEGILTKSNAE